MKQVERKLVTEVVMEQIVDYIRQNNLKPGDKLPNEQDFLNSFGVSRPTLREALRSLKVTGLIDLQPGSGIYVGHPKMLSLLAHGPVPSLLTTTGEIREFIEARRVLEPEVAALAAEKATDSELEELTASITQMEKTIAEKAYEKAHYIDFHQKLYQAAHNQVLFEMTEPIVMLLSTLIPYIIKDREKRYAEEEFKEKFLLHKDLCQAVCTRDPEKARQAALDHVNSTFEGWYRAVELMEEEYQNKDMNAPAREETLLKARELKKALQY